MNEYTAWWFSYDWLCFKIELWGGKRRWVEEKLMRGKGEMRFIVKGREEKEREREDRGFGRSQQVDFSSTAESLVSLLSSLPVIISLSNLFLSLPLFTSPLHVLNIQVSRCRKRSENESQRERKKEINWINERWKRVMTTIVVNYSSSCSTKSTSHFQPVPNWQHRILSCKEIVKVNEKCRWKKRKRCS